MDFSGEFGLKKRTSLDEALQWAEALRRAVARWAPKVESEDPELFPNWIGTGVASTSRSATPSRDDWTAVVIMENPAPMKLQYYRAFWRNADAYMRRQEASFAALVVGQLNVAAGVSVGGSVGVPGGYAGTLGGTVAAGTGSVALTAGHVVSSGDNSGRAEQPAAGFGGPQTEIGRVVGWSQLLRRRNKADLGAIRLHPNCDIGDRSTFSTLRPEDLAGLRVRKTGASTGTTLGHVALVGTDGIPVFHDGRRKYFDGLVGIVEVGGQEFAGPGDSGAFVFPDEPSGGDAAVGMVVAVSAGHKGIGQPVCWAVGSTAMSDTLGKILRDGSRTEA